jgi:integrase
VIQGNFRIFIIFTVKYFFTWDCLLYICKISELKTFLKFFNVYILRLDVKQGAILTPLQLPRLTPNTRYLFCLKHASKHLDLELRNPCNGLSKLPEDRQIQLEACNLEQQRLITFVYETGCRIGEAINLTYNDVKNDYVVLYTRKSRNSVKTPRFVPKPLIIGEGSGKVFKFTAYPRFLEEKVRELDLPKWNWHGLRRRRASIWANEDKPLFQIMMLLGHSNISTTQRYLFNLGIVKM